LPPEVAGGDPVCLWNVSTGKLLRRFDGPDTWAQHLQFSPDGRILAVGSWNRVRIYDLLRPGPEAFLHVRGHEEVAFSPDGRVLAIDGYGPILLWDVVTGEAIDELEYPGSQIDAIVFSPDGTRIATGSWDTTAIVWDFLPGGIASKQNAGVPGPEDLERFWRALGEGKTSEQYEALRRLILGRDLVVAFIREHWAPPWVEASDRVRDLITKLDSDDFTIRDRATGDLKAISNGVTPGPGSFRRSLPVRVSQS